MNNTQVKIGNLDKKTKIDKLGTKTKLINQNVLKAERIQSSPSF